MQTVLMIGAAAAMAAVPEARNPESISYVTDLNTAYDPPRKRNKGSGSFRGHGYAKQRREARKRRNRK